MSLLMQDDRLTRATVTQGPQSPETRLARYQALEGACEEMLAAARRDDWAQVSRLKSSCGALIDALRNSAPEAGMSNVERKERFRVLRQIVVLDGALRQLAQPWVRNLDAMLNARDNPSAVSALRT